MTPTDPTLTMMTRPTGVNLALIDGSVSPVGFELRFADVPVLVDGFRRMVRSLEFDVSEMALTTYLTAREHGVEFTALPVFLVRDFHHGAIRHMAQSSIRHPKDLEGRRVGVNRGYTVTTGVWARGILSSEYDVDLSQVTWVLSGDEHVASYVPPGNVVSAPAGADLEDLLIRGELDAIIGADVTRADITPVIPNPQDAALTALKQRSFYPINHLIVVKNTVLQQYPELPTRLYDALVEAKVRYLRRLSGGDVATSADRRYARVLEITGSDPLPYGVEPNRVMLEQLVSFALEQQILKTSVNLEEVFAG